MNFRRTQIACLLVAGSLLAACGGKATVYRRADAPKVTYEEEKFLVMPTEVRGFEGDTTKFNTALAGGFAAAFAKQGISLQPVKSKLQDAGMGNLSEEMATGIHSAVQQDQYDLNETGRPELAAIPEKLAQLLEVSVTSLGLDYKPRFVAVVHVAGMGAGDLPSTIKYSVIGAIYDLEAGKVHSATYYESTTPEKVLLGDLGTVGEKLKSTLLAGG